MRRRKGGGARGIKKKKYSKILDWSIKMEGNYETEIHFGQIFLVQSNFFF
jgi:hypothetical protein